MNQLNKSKYLHIASFSIFLFFTFWWSVLQIIGLENFNSVQLYSGTYGFMALWGSFCGFFVAKQWGGRKSIMGKAILVFSFSLFLQEFGQLSYSFYTYFLDVSIPYPSIADIGYLGSVPVYIYGLWLLGKAAGIKISLKNYSSKLSAFIFPLILLVLSYSIFLRGYLFDWSNPLVIFLDFGYPLGEAIYISFALLLFFLSKNTLGGIMRKPIFFIVLALLMQFISEFTFLYQASQDTWTSGGINEYMYLLSYFIMTLALLRFATVVNKLNNG